MRLPLLAAGLAIALVARIATAQTPAPAPAPAPSPPPAGSAAPPQPAWTIPPEPAPTTAPAPPPSAAPAPAPAPAPAQAAPAPEPEPVYVPGATAGTNWRAGYRRAPDAPASSWEVAGLLGFELEARGAFMLPDNGASPVLAPHLYNTTKATGTVVSGIDSPFGYDPFGLEITAGYRLLPYLSVGGFFNYANYSDNGESDETSQLQRVAWQLGAYVRFYGVDDSDKHGGFPYLPGSTFSRLQPWVELGVGYTEDTASYVLGQHQGNGYPDTQDFYLTYQGIVTNLRIGLDWRLAPIFSVGPVLGYGRAFGLSACADSEVATDPNSTTPSSLTSANTCSSGFKGAQAQTNDYGVIFAGIFLKVTLGPDVR